MEGAPRMKLVGADVDRNHPMGKIPTMSALGSGWAIRSMMHRPFMSKPLTLAALALAVLLANEKDTQLFGCKMYAQKWDSDFRAYWGSHGRWQSWGTEQARWEFKRCMAQYGED